MSWAECMLEERHIRVSFFFMLMQPEKPRHHAVFTSYDYVDKSHSMLCFYPIWTQAEKPHDAFVLISLVVDLTHRIHVAQCTRMKSQFGHGGNAVYLSTTGRVRLIREEPSRAKHAML